MRRYPIAVAAWLCATASYGAAYEVGPGKPYSAIAGVPWQTLAAGDHVLIHWQDAPYTEKWVICRFYRVGATIDLPR